MSITPTPPIVPADDAANENVAPVDSAEADRLASTGQDAPSDEQQDGEQQDATSADSDYLASMGDDPDDES